MVSEVVASPVALWCPTFVFYKSSNIKVMDSLAEDAEMEDISCSQDSSQESQDGEETQRRQLRRAYRDLINETCDNSEETSTAPPTETLHKASLLFSKVKRTQEAVLDSKLVLLVATRGRKCASSLPINLCTFDPEEFVAKVRTAAGSSNHSTDPLSMEMWANLGRMSETCFRTSSPFWYLYGSAGDIARRVRAAPTRRTVVEGPDRAPTVAKQVKSGEQTNQETTTEHVAHIHRVLKSLYAKLGNQALPYFEFVIHPQSFAKTCENIFHLSFLVNEGHARVTLDENNLLLVEPVGRDENNTETRRTMKNVFAMTLNMQQWRDAVRALQITRLAIPS